MKMTETGSVMGKMLNISLFIKMKLGPAVFELGACGSISICYTNCARE